MRQAISPQRRLEVTLLFLASGKNYTDLQYLTRIPHNTLSKLIPEVLAAIKTHLINFIKTTTTPQEWQRVSERFNSLWNFPHCIVALDGRHIEFCAPIKESAYYRCYKGCSSIELLALVDADHKFLFVNIGTNGRMNDAGVLLESDFSQALKDGSLNLPPPTALPESHRNLPLPYVIIGDDIFPLMKNLLKPYGSRGNDYTKRVFDYRLGRTRCIVENAFGILTHRFRILLSTINLSTVCCLLHNYILSRKPVVCTIGSDGEPQAEACLLPHLREQQEPGNRHAKDAIMIRDEFRSYFSGPGRVPWQDRAVAEFN